jgi:hypothetical protein
MTWLQSSLRSALGQKPHIGGQEAIQFDDFLAGISVFDELLTEDLFRLAAPKDGWPLDRRFLGQKPTFDLSFSSRKTWAVRAMS